jgi:predicted nucleotidyltransferase
MLDEIQKEILNIEKSHKVEILYAVESGSRAWGFASPDSDFDIRFIYKQPSDFYLSLWEKPDVIEFMTDKNLDGSGWDLPKALRLLSKSNVPLIEWLFSPIIYKKNEAFLSEMQAFAKECFSPIKSVHHYISTTKNFIEECSLEKVKLKSYFYALRTSLASQWIIETNTIPPVAFSDLVIIAPTNIQNKISEIQAIKSIQDEKYLHPNDTEITKYLLNSIEQNIEIAKNMPDGKKMYSELENFYLNILKNDYI